MQQGGRQVLFGHEEVDWYVRLRRQATSFARIPDVNCREATTRPQPCVLGISLVNGNRSVGEAIKLAVADL